MGRLVLWTHAANADARAFYLRAGFREFPAGQENDEGLPQLRMAWQEGNSA